MVGLEVRQQLVWWKNQLVIGHQDYQWKHEPCFYGWKEGETHYFIEDRTNTTTLKLKNKPIDELTREEALDILKRLEAEEKTILEDNKPLRSEAHPTMKPVRLMARLIRNSSMPGDNILDLFGGSGSTLIACEETDRKCFMMEYDPHYCDIIIDRWEKFTGRKAEKI